MITGVAGVLAAGVIRDDLQAHLALARVGEQPPSSTPISLPVRTNLSSELRAGGEALGSPGDPVAAVAVVVLEPDFRLLERAGTRATLNETDELDDLR